MLLADRLSRLDAGQNGHFEVHQDEIGVSGGDRIQGRRAIVGRADERAVAQFRDRTDVREVELEPLPLEEIFVALCGADEGGAS